MSLPNCKSAIYDLVIVGGGPAGFMSAITAGENGVKSICILESSAKNLEKVRISGGGRCNITNSCFDNTQLVSNYPRGKRSLLSPFSYFSTLQAFYWFKERGLDLSIESDGRIFPSSNNSQDVIECLVNLSIQYGIEVRTNSHVIDIDYYSKLYLLKLRYNHQIKSNKIMISTGGHPSGREIAKRLGHQIVRPVPALFSFTLNDTKLTSCAGISVSGVHLKLQLQQNHFKGFGDILITHKGLSGPAILKLSSFAARELYLEKYKASLVINWTGETFSDTKIIIVSFKKSFPNRLLYTNSPFSNIPKRLWQALLYEICIKDHLKWNDLSNKSIELISKKFFNTTYFIKGRGPFGDEFVTAGGVSTDEVDFKSMESKIKPGLFFAGEVLNLDGITGGFNFQLCWTSGWIAGNAIAHNN